MLALLLERILEIRAGDTWRNVRAQLDAIKVIEYERGEARVQQTTELSPSLEALLRKLKVPPPPKIHSVVSVADKAAAPADGAITDEGEGEGEGEEGPAA